MEDLYKMAAAALGVVISFFTGLPVIMWVLIGVMSIDYITGLCCGAMGVSPKTETGGLSSRAAFKGLLRKCAVLLVVLLAALLDLAVESNSGIQFTAVTGATCLWFIASEGISVLENAAAMGLPIPSVLRRALDIMRDSGGQEQESEENKEE